MKQPNAPCKGCNDRKIGCHAECERYSEFGRNRRIWLDEIRNEKRSAYTVHEVNRYKRGPSRENRYRPK